MGDTLHRMQVIIEGKNSKFKQSAKESTKDTKKMVSDINGELGKIKNPMKSMMQDDKSMQGIRNMQSMIRGMFKDMKSGLIPKEITKGVKEYVKEAQVAAGIKVYTDDYLRLQDDISNTGKELSKLRDKLSGMDDSKRFVPTKEFSDLENGIETAGNALDKLYEKRRKLENSGKAMLETDDYAGIKELLSDAETRLSKLHDKKNTWKSLGVSENGSSSMQSLTEEIRNTEKEVTVLKGELEDLEKSGEAYKPTQAYKDLTYEIGRTEEKLKEYKTQREQMVTEGTNVKEAEAFEKVRIAISSAEMQLDSYEKKKRSMESSGQDTQFSGGLANRSFGASAAATIGHTTRKLKEMNAQVAESISRIPFIGRVASEAAYLGSKAFGGLRAVFQKVTPAIKKAGGAFSALIQKFSNGIPILGKANNGINRNSSSFGKGLISVLKYTVGIRSLFVLFNRLRSSMATGFQNLSQYSADTNNNLSTLKSGLNQLQNSFATAFAPVLNVVVPILNTLMDHLVAASNAVAQFMAALTGQGSYVVAKRVATDFAAGASAAGDAAGGAADNAERLQRTLMGFDEINKLDDNSSSGSGGSGGGSGSGAGDMFTTETVTNQFADFAEKIKAAWAEADFTEIGTIIGTKLKEGLDTIPWDMVQESAKKVGKSIATLINGFVETSGLADSIGNTVAQALNTGILGIESFSSTLHWDSIGKFVSDGVNGALTRIKWENLNNAANNLGKGLSNALNSVMTEKTFSNIGKSFANAINTVLSGAYTFVSNADWSGWGKAIAYSVNDFFSTFDWKKAGLTFNKAVKGIIKTITSAIEKVNWDEVGTSIAEAIKAIDFDDLLRDVGRLIWAAIRAGIKAWKSAFDAAPVETTIITVLGALKFTGLGKVIGDTIWGIIQAQFVGTGAKAAADVAAAGLSTTLSSAIATALSSVAVIGTIATGVALIYTGVKDMLADPNFLKNKDVEQYIKDNPGALGTGAETPEIEIKITGDNEPLKNSVDKSKEYLNETLPNETAVSVDADTTSAKKKIGVFGKYLMLAGLPVSVAVKTTKKQLTGTISNLVKNYKLGVDTNVSTKSNTFQGFIKSLVSGLTLGVPIAVSTGAYSFQSLIMGLVKNFTLGINAKAKLTSTEDNLSAAQKTIGTTSKFTWISDALSTAQKTFNTTSRFAWISDALSAAQKTINTTSKYTGSSDSLSSAQKTINTTAKYTGINNALSAAQKTIGGVVAHVTSLTKVNGLSLALTAALTVVSGVLKAVFRKDGGVYTGGSWKPITAYAGGGIPGSGQMFIAREAGPELVGTLGGHTAVLNNDQIVSSVSAGVYRAVVAALGQNRSQNNDGGTPTVIVYVGGKQVTDVVVEQVNKQTVATGVCPILI